MIFEIVDDNLAERLCADANYSNLIYNSFLKSAPPFKPYQSPLSVLEILQLLEPQLEPGKSFNGPDAILFMCSFDL